ncbi:MAG: ClpXP protease specificity-enhancing factor [Gammaproteobacteria bacterium]|nr:ClpXP protease specificity-enhancing factor [Gammaproteobacteria bacterium]
MTSSRPYIVRALYEWILENKCTPYVLVNAFDEGVQVPQEHVKDGQIILNITPSAVQSLSIHDSAIEFHGRFGGIPKHVFVPIEAIMGIYAKENGQGMMFDLENDGSDPSDPEGPDEPPDSSSEDSVGSNNKKPSLKLVK